jgi:Rod binding domain-containing protein
MNADVTNMEPVHLNLPADTAVHSENKPGTVENAAREFEALLITEMLRAARGDESGWLGAGEDSTASSAMEMAEEFLARALSAQGGLGLASVIRQGLDQK